MKNTYKLIKTYRPNQEFPFKSEGAMFEVESERLMNADGIYPTLEARVGGNLYGIPNPAHADNAMSPRFVAIFQKQ